jgi:hypothetical protein
MSMPFPRDEFFDPQKAILRLGAEAALEKYRIEVEPLYRQDGMPGLPRDWEWRKLLVHHRASGRCRCGQYVPPTTDPHHVIFRRDGGDHSLENLELLCWRCHKEQHPEYDKKRSEHVSEF